MEQTAVLAKEDTIKRMLTPLQKLVEKLNTPIGADGAIFRDDPARAREISLRHHEIEAELDAALNRLVELES